MFAKKEKWPASSGQGGQVLLIVVLVMIVSLTVGLSVASRSITNLRTSQEEAVSQKALFAAEAGIEQSLQTNTSIANGSFTNNTTYNTTVTQVLGTSFLLNGGNIIPQDDGADLWLSDYSTDDNSIYNNPWSGNLTIYWGESGASCNNPALEIALVSGSKNSPNIKRYAYDPCVGRKSSNNFTAPSGGGSINGKTFYHSATLNSVSSAFIARIIPLYGSTSIGISGNNAFPSQGYIVSSVGKSGDTQRKINVFKGYPQLPAQYFSYGLFSP